VHRVLLASIDAVTELAPFGGSRRVIELRVGGRTVDLELDHELVVALCTALRGDGAADGDVPVEGARPDTIRWSRRPALAGGMAVLALVGATAWWPTDDHVSHEVAATRPSATSASSTSTGSTQPPSSATSSTAQDPTTSTSGATTSTSTTSSSTTSSSTTTSSPPVMATAPLTGLQVPLADLARVPIVAKIDASAPAMPQVGLDLADVVLEVKIEFGLQRYLAVWHSRQPEVIGPLRSARTTDPDLLAMFGHPLFAFSGANPGVVDRLAATTWKTGVGPGEVPAAYFRDEGRPWPHNLFAHSQTLRTRPSPYVVPAPRFVHRPAGTAGPGVPVRSVTTSAGARSSFDWDPALGGWRRSTHGRAHLHPDGRPVAPTNVVVVETFYGVSAADANSPEAVSTGWGRAWVLSDGKVAAGTWTRLDRNAPYDLRDGAGAPLTLAPDSTWVVLADREPSFVPG
jgi:hypothetical protein